MACAFDVARGVLVVHGGVLDTGSGSTTLGTMWEWDGATWTQRTPAGAPGPRSRHAMAYDESRGVIVMSGGLLGSTRLPQTYEFNGTSWALRHTAALNFEVYSHRMVYDRARHEIVRFGGGTGGGSTNRTEVWNGSTWILRVAGGPSARKDHMMAYHEPTQRVVLFGGQESGVYNDTWEWNGVSWQQRFPAHTPPAMVNVGFAYSGTSRKIMMASDNFSAPEIWTWDGTDWTQKTSNTGPFAAGYSELTYDPLTDRGIFLAAFQPNVAGFAAHWDLEVPVQHAGSWTTFGTACASSVGTPQLHATPGSLPFVGQPFTVALSGIPGSIFTPAFLVSGFSNTQSSTWTLPHELSGLGMPGCHALVSPDATELLANNAGTASKTWQIPPSTALVGVTFHVQGAAFDPPANSAGVVLSNAGTILIGQV
ncbi:MAG: hypothetical protein IT456_08870 [Planctomycetes bacterium]|nr:hypothetical protein [Planctomycetota bacterium]